MTPADAQLLIDTAQNAPLENMRHASAVSQALQRAKDHFDSFFNAKAPAVVPVGTTPPPAPDLMPDTAEPRLLSESP